MSATPEQGPPGAEQANPIQAYPDRTWCALHTRARHEKKVEAACLALRIPCYLPLRTHRTFSGGKTNTFHLPVFTGYVFAALAPGEIAPLKQTNSVAQKIAPADDRGLIRDLTNIRKVELARLELETAPTIRQGQQVLVVGGPLAGIRGTVVRYKNRRRLQVAVEAINQVLLVDIPDTELVPAPETPVNTYP